MTSINTNQQVTYVPPNQLIQQRKNPSPSTTRIEKQDIQTEKASTEQKKMPLEEKNKEKAKDGTDIASSKELKENKMELVYNEQERRFLLEPLDPSKKHPPYVQKTATKAYNVASELSQPEKPLPDEAAHKVLEG